MANPTSAGVGTGTAVVKDYDVLNKATSDFFKGYKADRVKAQAKKEAEDAAKNKALSELRGDFGDFDTSKMREADKQAAVDMHESGLKQFEGHWGDILNGDPEWSARYRDAMNAQKIFISNSVESKQEMKDIYKKINEPESGYSPEKIKQMSDYMTATGSTMKDMKEKGLYARDMVVGEPLKKMDASFNDSGEELYTIKQFSRKKSDGSSYSEDVKVWKPDSEAFPKFKATLSMNPDLMQDLEIMYPGVPFDEQAQKFYDEYKTSRETQRKDVDIVETPEKEDGGNSFGGGKFRSNYFKGDDYEGFTVSKSGGGQLAPISTTIKDANGQENVVSIIPTEFVKTVSGNAIRGMVVKDTWESLTPEQKADWKKENPGKKVADFDVYAAKGDVVNVPVTPEVDAKIQSKYGFKSFDQHLSGLKGGGSTTDNQSKAIKAFGEDKFKALSEEQKIKFLEKFK